VHTAHGELIEQAPHLYQDIDGARHDVAGSFVLDRAGIVRLQVGDYDHAQSLVIDPVLGYSTYLGGAEDEVVSATAVDPKTGATYVMGTRYPVDFFGNGEQTGAFVSKYDAQGNLAWSETLGNPLDQFQFGVAGTYTTHKSYGGGIAIGADGSIYATYQTTDVFWTVDGPPDDNGSNFNDVHPGDTANLVKIASDGTILSDRAFADTHNGGNTPSDVYLNVGTALAVDTAGAAFVPLSAFSPAGSAIFDGAIVGASFSDYVFKLNADGTRAFKATVPLFANAIAVDTQGDFFIAGTTDADGLFTSPGAFQAHHPAPTDGLHLNPYIAEYDPSGQGVIAGTYLGSTQGGLDGALGTPGTPVETVTAIALSPTDPNLLYVVGATNAPNFPVQSYLNASQLQPSQRSLNLGVTPDTATDAFVAALDTRSMSLVSSTYLGGSGTDLATSVAVDRSGNVYVAGETAPRVTVNYPNSEQLGPSDFPLVNPRRPGHRAGGSQHPHLSALLGRQRRDLERPDPGRQRYGRRQSLPACSGDRPEHRRRGGLVVRHPRHPRDRRAVFRRCQPRRRAHLRLKSGGESRDVRPEPGAQPEPRA
jgi:Beta-propeller repeat